MLNTRAGAPEAGRVEVWFGLRSVEPLSVETVEPLSQHPAHHTLQPPRSSRILQDLQLALSLRMSNSTK